MSQTALIHSQKALSIKRTLGLRRAAGFLRNKGVSLAEALYLLTGSTREVSFA